MGDLPTLPLFVDDYDAATAHLSMEEDGAYMRLLRLCWRTPGCSIPDDDAWIARMMRADDAAMARVVKPVLREFFSRSRGRWFQKRLRAEFGYVSAKVHDRKAAGKKGGDAKARKIRENAPSKATILPEQTASKTLAPNPTQPNLVKEGGGSARGDNQPPDDLRSRILTACGADPVSGLTGPNGNMIGTRADMQLAERWRADLGLSDDAIIAVIEDAMCRKRDGPPSRLNYFDQPMQREAGRRFAPPLTPIEGGRSGQQPAVDRHETAAADAFRRRHLAAATARRAPAPDFSDG